MPSENVITKGLVEKIGMKDSVFTISVQDDKVTETLNIPNHEVAVQLLLEKLLQHNIISSYEEIDGVGHRICMVVKCSVILF